MKRTTKYVALDVHQATTSAAVREEGGRVIARTILPTAAPALVEFFRGMRGAIHVAFEEGTQAQWLGHRFGGASMPALPDSCTPILAAPKEQQERCNKKAHQGG